MPGSGVARNWHGFLTEAASVEVAECLVKASGSRVQIFPEVMLPIPGDETFPGSPRQPDPRSRRSPALWRKKF